MTGSIHETLAQLADLLVWVRHQIGPPWTFDRITVDAGLVVAVVLLYTAIRINWIAGIREVPGRIRWAWKLQRGYLGTGLVTTGAGIVLAWVAYTRYHFPPDWGVTATVLIGGLAFCLVFSGGIMTLMSSLLLLLSPFGEDHPRPSTLGLDAVRDQQAYGDARAAAPQEVDAALRGGGSGSRYEFKD
jgi:hypothetical protein